jgi:HD-like signal output (HDOD) protein/CheY-like chemotaxis protein
MIHILFVDDEMRILDGVRRSMHGMRDEWHMRFSGSGAAALVELALDPADVVVTDMRMPGMDGSQLLAEVKRLYPEAVRVILSGQSQPDSTVRALRIAHQYLSKPCDAPTLKSAITRTMTLKSLLSSDQLGAIVGSVDTLPSPPRNYQYLLECLRNPAATIDELAAIIRRDVVMTAKVVRLANSGLFGIREPVRTVERAVAFIGMESISTLVLGQELFDANNPITIPGFDLERLGRHSFETAAWARAVALHEGLTRGFAETAFLAGMLHDVGRIVFATREAPSAEATAQMQAHHAAVGGYLLGLWGFPDSVVGAIVWHHTPSKSGESGLGLCGLLHIADLLAHERESDVSEASPEALDPGYLEALGLAGSWSDWQATRPVADRSHTSAT